MRTRHPFSGLLSAFKSVGSMIPTTARDGSATRRLRIKIVIWRLRGSLSALAANRRFGRQMLNRRKRVFVGFLGNRFRAGDEAPSALAYRHGSQDCPRALSRKNQELRRRDAAGRRPADGGDGGQSPRSSYSPWERCSCASSTSPAVPLRLPAGSSWRSWQSTWCPDRAKRPRRKSGFTKTRRANRGLPAGGAVSAEPGRHHDTDHCL